MEELLEVEAVVGCSASNIPRPDEDAALIKEITSELARADTERDNNNDGTDTTTPKRDEKSVPDFFNLHCWGHGDFEARQV